MSYLKFLTQGFINKFVIVILLTFVGLGIYGYYIEDMVQFYACTLTGLSVQLLNMYLSYNAWRKL